MADRAFGFATRTVHAGSRPDPTTGARALPIYQTTSYVFEDPESAAAYFNLQEYGNTYTRIVNPTVSAFEERIANLDGGVGAVAFASGLAAQSAAFFTLLQPGDHVVSSSALYGGTITQLKHFLGKLSVSLDFVDPDNLDAWKKALKPETKLLFAETIGNPGGNILDIERVAEIAHEPGPLCSRDELVGTEDAPIRVFPPDQRLGADDTTGFERDLRLPEHTEFVVVERRAEPHRPTESLAGPGIESSIVNRS